jgi:hypothetical protein
VAEHPADALANALSALSRPRKPPNAYLSSAIRLAVEAGVQEGAPREQWVTEHLEQRLAHQKSVVADVMALLSWRAERVGLPDEALAANAQLLHEHSSDGNEARRLRLAGRES